MRSADTPVTAQQRRAHRRQARAALLRKEWQEQRWRFFLGTVVLSGLLAGMLRAQIVPAGEAALLIYWPVGVVMVIFLAMGPVASERADRTWAFLVAQPVSRADVLLAKWTMGMLQLVGMMTIATVTGLLAMWSRGFRGQTTVLEDVIGDYVLAAEDVLVLAAGHPVGWLCMVATAATIALACWYTPLFLLLTRARNEFTAALGGILLTIALHAWLAQFFVTLLKSKLWLISVALNPLSIFVLAVNPESVPWVSGFVWVPALVMLHVLVWILLPLWWVNRVGRRAPTK